VLRTRTSTAGLDSSFAFLANASRYSRWVFALQLESASPPTDWSLWMRDLVRSERELHGGTAGVMDSAFYATVARYVERHGAPLPVQAAVSFLRGLAVWDFDGAARAADILIPLALRNEDWLPPDVLRDGAVVAALRRGERERARAVYGVLRARTERRPTDLRTHLLAAYVTAERPIVLAGKAPN
jgi:hypothetical protein